MGRNTATAGQAKYEDFELRGSVGILERLRTLDLESYDEFSTSARVWVNGEWSKPGRNKQQEMNNVREIRE